MLESGAHRRTMLLVISEATPNFFWFPNTSSIMRDQKAQSCNKNLNEPVCMLRMHVVYNGTQIEGNQSHFCLLTQCLHASFSPYAATRAVLAVAAPRGFPCGSPSGKPVSGKELPLKCRICASRKWHEQTLGPGFQTSCGACSLLMSTQVSSSATFFISPSQQFKEDGSITSSVKVIFLLHGNYGAV